MLLVKPSAKIIAKTPDALKVIELAGRVCYKSEDRMTASNESAIKFIQMILNKGHESVLEHASATVHFVVDRGVSHEIVRHRIASYSQESTRYVASESSLMLNIDTDEDVIDAYESGLSMRVVANRSGKTEWEIYKILDKNNIKRRPLGNTGCINHDYFELIDTPEKAYLMGVIQADGCVMQKDDRNTLTITQHKNNSWYLKRMIRNFIRPNANTANDKNCHSLMVVSEKLISDLIAKGIVPNKSELMTKENAEQLWRSIPENLKHCFLRGFLDGDGTLRFFKQKNAGETDSCNVTWYGNEHLLNIMSRWIFDNYKYETKITLVSGTNKLFRLTITKPVVGDSIVKNMLNDFVFPYGHPVKTARMIERVGGTYEAAQWGDSAFKVILPSWMKFDSTADWIWMEAIDESEISYRELRTLGWKPEQARSVLPNSLKTEVIMTANLREWRHFFKLRTAKAAHPSMREVVIPLLEQFKYNFPVIFDDISS